MRFEYSAGAFIYYVANDGIKFLILSREKDHDIPKGHIEKGETAHRRCKEGSKRRDRPYARVSAFLFFNYKIFLL